MLLEEGVHVEVDVHLYDVFGQRDQHQAARVRYQVRTLVVGTHRHTFLFLLLFISVAAVMIYLTTHGIELALLRYADLLDP